MESTEIKSLTDLSVGDIVEMRTDPTSIVYCRRKVLTPPLGLVIGLSWRMRDTYDTQKALFLTLDYIQACKGMKITEPTYIDYLEAKRECGAGKTVAQVFEDGGVALLWYSPTDGRLMQTYIGIHASSNLGFVPTLKYYLP